MKVLPILFASIWVACQNHHPPIIDGHFHVISPENWKESKSFKGPITDDTVLNHLKSSKADKAVAISSAFLFKARAKAAFENDYVAGLVRRHPQQIIGYCGVPLSQPWAKDELVRCINDLHLSGLKLHLKRPGPLSITEKSTGKLLRELFDVAQAQKPGLPILIDFEWLDSLSARIIAELSFDYPKLNIVVAHAFGTNFRQLGLAGTYYFLYPSLPRNLYIDISVTAPFYAASPDRESLLWHLRQIGTKNILFGSDYPVMTTEQALQGTRQLGFDKNELAEVLGGNLSQLIFE